MKFSGDTQIWEMKQWAKFHQISWHHGLGNLLNWYGMTHRCSLELAQLVPLPFSRGRSSRYSDGLHDFSVTIPTCYKDVSFLAQWDSGIFSL